MGNNTRKIALQRIETLNQIARETVHTEPAYARRYISLLRRIAQRTRTKIPPHIRRSFCRKCNTPLISGFNSHTRIRQTREPHISTTCQYCGNITRIPIRSNT
ncbi:ribonuclease P protein component 4 [Thermoproteota archaeon]